jgi:hypothetical protein
MNLQAAMDGYLTYSPLEVAVAELYCSFAAATDVVVDVVALRHFAMLVATGV